MIAISVTGCAGSDERGNPTVNPNSAALQTYPPEGVELQQAHVSWAVGHGSIADLVARANAVVVGEVIGAVPYKADDGTSIIMTDYTIAIERAAKGDFAEADEVIVAQTGGVLVGDGYEIQDNPLMRTGDRVLLFLIESPLRPDTYYVAGGPQGRYPVDIEDTVRTLRSEYPDRDIPSVGGIADRQLEVVLADAAEHADLPPPVFPTAPVN